MNDQPKVPALIEKADRSNMPSGMQPRPIVPQSFEQAYRFAELIVRSGMAPKGLDRVESCMVAILFGLEIGLTPMAALQSIAVVNGRPTVWGDGAIAIVRGSGLCEWVEESLDGEGEGMVATCRVKRKGDTKPVVGTFSVDDAKKAALWDKAGPWKQYPKRMLAARARAFALRDGFADFLRGIGIREEVQDYHVRDVTPPRPPITVTSGKKPPKPPPDPDPDDAHEPIDWDECLQSYDLSLSACKTADEYIECLQAVGSVFVDAPEAIAAEATKLEAAIRARIERDGEAR